MDKGRTSTNVTEKRKFMTMHKALHPRDNTELRKGESGVASIEDSVDTSIQRLEVYRHKHGGRLITAIKNNTDTTIINRSEKARKQKWKGKRLNGHFKQQANEISHEKSWTRLRKRNLKREIEPLLISQNNAIWTNYIKARIDKMQ